jgi:tRNA (guanine37-N1)-methyltransferase
MYPMRLWAVKVSRTLAEKTRRLLLQTDWINTDAQIHKDSEDILIPLKSQPSTADLEMLFNEMSSLKNNIIIIETEFEPKIHKPSLEDMLGFSPAFEVIGDIAVIDADETEAEKVARALMDFRKSIKVVLGATGPVSGEYRIREFVVLAGENRTHTIHTEYGCRYKVDLAKAYFSPRLATERKRVSDMVQRGQCVVDLFAGVGPFSILIGKSVPGSTLVAVDKNPAAVQFLKENIGLNKLDNVTAVEDDARHAAEEWKHSADHVIMNLPHSAREFLNSGIMVAKNGGMVHYYDITPEDDLYKTSWGLITEAAEDIGKKVECLDKRIVRTYAPYQYNVCIEFLVLEN